MGFTREELDRYRGAEVDDLLPGPGEGEVRLLIVGINPSLWTAATGTHFAYPGNRFYPALHVAGITERRLEFSDGMPPEDRAHLLARGIGITNVSPRATARASELSRDELREGGRALLQRVNRIAPRVVAVAGITAFRSAFGRRAAQLGPVQDPPTEHAWWTVPNPSGLNAHETIDTLAARYREVAIAAGITPLPYQPGDR